MKAPGIATKLYIEHEIKAFIGPPDSAETERIADLAAYWNIPILSGVSTYSALDNKKRYQTLTRTSNKISTIVTVTNLLFKEFEWNAAAIIYAGGYYEDVYNDLEESLVRQNVSVHNVWLPWGYIHESQFKQFMAEAVKKGRSK